METKKCNKCGEDKSIEEFYFRKDSNTYRSVCKCCMGEKKQKLEK